MFLWETNLSLGALAERRVIWCCWGNTSRSLNISYLHGQGAGGLNFSCMGKNKQKETERQQVNSRSCLTQFKSRSWVCLVRQVKHGFIPDSPTGSRGVLGLAFSTVGHTPFFQLSSAIAVSVSLDIHFKVLHTSDNKYVKWISRAFSCFSQPKSRFILMSHCWGFFSERAGYRTHLRTAAFRLHLLAHKQYLLIVRIRLFAGDLRFTFPTQAISTFLSLPL